MGTGEECPLRTLCYRQQNSHNPLLLTSRGSEQKNLHLLGCSLLMRKTFTQLTCLMTVSISRIHLFTCHIHPCQHPPRSAASARANCCISGNLPSPSPAGQIPQERRQPQLTSTRPSWWPHHGGGLEQDPSSAQGHHGAEKVVEAA